MLLRQEIETNDMWRSAESLSDTIREDAAVVQTTESVANEIVHDRSRTIKVIATIVALRILAQLCLDHLIVIVYQWLARMGVLGSLVPWLHAAIYGIVIGHVFLVGWIVARIAPRRVGFAICWGNCIGYCIYIAGFVNHLISIGLMRETLQSHSGTIFSRLATTAFAIFTMAVAEFIIAQFFLRRSDRTTQARLPSYHADSAAIAGGRSV